MQARCGLPVIRPESSVFAEEPSNFQKQTTRIDIDSDILPMSGRWAWKIKSLQCSAAKSLTS
jgi:hypothetical protein